ncbi:hypothetical protein SAMN04487969_1553 [Paenibacillus algorifonticola]|uniref:Uncharacterized protein n=1 Tax=Paenibacillus algorifonticola TaxID=684063 RepID=A0A1I2J9E1_9BACL|nr:hypothetical protein [Paenibacillus algorifonticola]SFF49321.1 hypothetical protein SAMN04487969_1553 [Paenibacillus algorifonticola]
MSMDLTHIRVTTDIKLELEKIKSRYSHVSSVSDAITHLIEENKRFQRRMEEQAKEFQKERELRNLNDLTLGVDRKNHLRTLQDELSLRNPEQIVDLLIHHYENNDKLDRSTLLFFASLKS